MTHGGKSQVAHNLSPVRALGASILLLLCALALTSCGGGGGGGGSSGGSGSNGSLQFTANVSSVTFNYVQDDVPAPQIVTITATGQYTGTLYVAAEVSGTGIASTIPLTVTGTTAEAQISVASGLTPGSYTGQIQLLACADSNCAQQIGNSPLNITYTITVHPALEVSPSSVPVTATSGAQPTQLVTVQLPDGQTTFSTVVGTSDPWLTVTASTTTSFTISFGSLPAGVYYGAIQVSSGSSSLTLNVTYTVTAPAGGSQTLVANPSSLTLGTVEGANTSSLLGITPPSWNPQFTATVEYPGGAASGWLTLTPTSGGEQVTATAAALTAGSYTANIRLHGTLPSADVLVPVALTVGLGLVRPADVPVTVGTETTAAALQGSVPVNVVSGPPTGWSATSNAPWLILTKSSGQTGDSLNYTIDPSQLGALPNGATSTARVTITPTEASMTPVAFNVNLGMSLPQIDTLAPYVQLSGQTARVILRGSGFSSIASPSTRVTLSSGSATNSATVVNDTEIVAQFASSAAGTYTVAISNALGVPATTGNVLVIDPQTFTYTAIPTGGLLQSLAYDPQRNSVYAANPTAQSIMSFHYTGSGWQTTSVPLTAAYDVGLKQDGSGLLATSSTVAPSGYIGSYTGSTIELLDPNSLATLQSIMLPNAIYSSATTGIPTTNDGRSWLAIEIGEPIGGGPDNMAFLTPGSLTPINLVPPGLQTLFYSGPWYAVSRDGERLIIVQESVANPQPPMLYMNAADSVVRTNPAGLTFSYAFSLSETGDRMLFDAITLRDGAFNLVGAATLPTISGQPSYVALNGQVSPDGSRVYILAYRSDAYVTTVAPRVFVFDATTAQASLSVLGYFDLADYPGCVQQVNNPQACGPRVVGAISLDGQTLFFAGNQNLIVAPVPATLSIVSRVRRTPAAQKPRLLTTPWPLNIH
jgi:hypothetical protein